MKLSDLKSRMVVEDKNGERAMVVGDTLMFEDNTVHFSVYNSDMTCKDDTTAVRDIVKVYDEVAHFSYIKKGQLKLIWER